MIASMLLATAVASGATCRTPPECLAEARATAAQTYHAVLYFDERDIHLLAVILAALRQQQARGTLPAGALEAETARWGTAYGEVLRTRVAACWGWSAKAHRQFPHVLRIDCRADREWDVVALVRRFISGPLQPIGHEQDPQVTIGISLKLRLLD